MKINLKIAKLAFLFSLLFFANTHLLADDGALIQALENSNRMSSVVIVLLIFSFALFEITFYFYRFKKEHSQTTEFKKEHSQTTETSSNNEPERHQQSLKGADTNYINLRESFNNLSDEFKILRQDIEKKDEEITRYKEGYDAGKVKKYFKKFVSVDLVIKEYINDNKIDLEGLNDIQGEMEEALAEYDIEVFYPKLGDDYRTTKGVAEVSEKQKIETSNKDEHLNIAKVIEPGYRRKIDDGLSNEVEPRFQIITDAKVAIYVYKQSE